MLRTKELKDLIKEIPSSWIFEHYLHLTTKLIGQDIKIKSIFNPTEKVPSMCIYICRTTGDYKFKDFSSDSQGDGISLIKTLFNLEYKESVKKILADYEMATKQGTVVKKEITPQPKYQICDYEARSWTEFDAKYWTKFKIGSKTLEKYNVMPLKSYVMSNGETEVVVSHHHIYGYFRKDGLLYKIYQPKVDNQKFWKVKSHVQGLDQLTGQKPNLVIHSSLKDLMSFEQLKFKTIECIAPDSENTMISESLMWSLIDKYETVITLFDNDAAGKKAIEKYKKTYGINGFTLDLEKDVADSIAKYGLETVKSHLVQKLTDNIHTSKRCKETLTLEWT